MNDETKDAVRLLVECMDELRVHDTCPSHRTNPDLKAKLVVYFDVNGLTDPIAMANILCDNPLKGKVT